MAGSALTKATSGREGNNMPISSFTTFDDPLAPGSSTRAFGINDTGQIVGSYADTQTHAFFLSGTVFITIDPPSTTDSEAPRAGGANDLSGCAAGRCEQRQTLP